MRQAHQKAALLPSIERQRQQQKLGGGAARLEVWLQPLDLHPGQRTVERLRRAGINAVERLLYSRPTALRSSCKGLGWTRPRLLISLWRYSWSASAIAAYLCPWSIKRRLDYGAILALVAQQEQRRMRRILRRLTAATVKARDQHQRGASGSNRREAPHVELVSVRPQRQRGTMGASVRWLPRPAVHRPEYRRS